MSCGCRPVPDVSPAEALRQIAILAEAGIVTGDLLARAIREQARRLDTEATATDIDATTIDLRMAAALARQVLSGRVRSLRWATIETLAGVTLVLAARQEEGQVRA